ncbi:MULTISPECIES: aminodeoxychorismate lyase [unclassified Corynebacterium]|uniref:aminodeoxychorismate lyase n=1 Tax=unclassified Corynebacterium TaxID=2624378 RepID=UPI0030A32159
MKNSQTSLVLIDVLSGDTPFVVDASQPFLFADDLGAVRGDGVFETLLVRDGHTCNTKRHEDRFLSSSAMLEMPEPDLEQWRAANALALAELRKLGIGDSDGSLRWVYSRGRESTGEPTGYVLASISPDMGQVRRQGVKVMLAQRGFSLDLGSKAPWALIGAKTLSYAANMAALRYAKANDFDDVIFVSAEGNLLEGPTSTIIIVRGTELLTPKPGEGILPGTTQAALFAQAEKEGWTCVEANLTPEDLQTADSVWLVSSVRIAVRVTTVDGQPLAEPSAESQLAFHKLCDDALASN